MKYLTAEKKKRTKAGDSDVLVLSTTPLESHIGKSINPKVFNPWEKCNCLYCFGSTRTAQPLFISSTETAGARAHMGWSYSMDCKAGFHLHFILNYHSKMGGVQIVQPTTFKIIIIKKKNNFNKHAIMILEFRLDWSQTRWTFWRLCWAANDEWPESKHF